MGLQDMMFRPWCAQVRPELAYSTKIPFFCQAQQCLLHERHQPSFQILFRKDRLPLEPADLFGCRHHIALLLASEATQQGGHGICEGGACQDGQTFPGRAGQQHGLRLQQPQEALPVGWLEGIGQGGRRGGLCALVFAWEIGAKTMNTLAMKALWIG